MKKIISIALCLGLVATSFVACSSRKYVPEEKKENNKNNAVTYEQKKYEVPEEQKNYSVDVKYLEGIDAAVITGYTGEETDLVLPSALNHEDYPEALPVLAIGDAAFLGNENLKSVTVPEGVVSLGIGAFQNCANLETVTLPETLKTIDENCFYNSGLKSVNIPASLEKIGDYAFSSYYVETPWYKSLTGETVIVGDGILLKASGNRNVTFGDEVKSVAYYAFKNISDVEITFGNALKDVSSVAVFNESGKYDSISFKYPAENDYASMSFTNTRYKHEALPAVVAE